LKEFPLPSKSTSSRLKEEATPSKSNTGDRRHPMKEFGKHPLQPKRMFPVQIIPYIPIPYVWRKSMDQI
jgi:hypothetical protein